MAVDTLSGFVSLLALSPTSNQWLPLSGLPETCFVGETNNIYQLFKLHHNTEFLAHRVFPLNSAELLTAAVFVGMLVGGILVGSAADRLGRRRCLIISLAVNCTFAAVSSAAPSVGWLIAARVCAGLGESR